MRGPRLKRPSTRNVVSMRDWQKMTGQRQTPPPKRREPPVWLLWLVLGAIAAALTWYQS